MKRYFLKRALRIIPAFVASYVICVFLIAPALGADVNGHVRSALIHLAFLHDPPAFFGGVEPHYRTINGAMWTISYEVRCYLLVAILWRCGILTNKVAFRTFFVTIVLLSVLLEIAAIKAHIEPLANHAAFDLVIGRPSRLAGFLVVFLIGSLVYQNRQRILPYISSGVLVAVSAIIMLPSGRLPFIGILALNINATIVIFWLIFHADLGRLSLINNRWDISYGIYLYGWPSAMIFIWAIPGITPLSLSLLALTTAGIWGLVSWLMIERHFKLKDDRLFGIHLRWLEPVI